MFDKAVSLGRTCYLYHESYVHYSDGEVTLDDDDADFPSDSSDDSAQQQSSRVEPEVQDDDDDDDDEGTVEVSSRYYISVFQLGL